MFCPGGNSGVIIQEPLAKPKPFRGAVTVLIVNTNNSGGFNQQVETSPDDLIF